jgi:hypothetical protein
MKRKLCTNQTMISLSKVKGLAKRYWCIFFIGLLITTLFILYEYKTGKHSNIDVVKTNVTIYIDSSEADSNIKKDHVQEAGIMADSLSNMKSNEVTEIANNKLKENGLKPIELGSEVPVIFYDYATSKTATLQLKGLDPSRSKAVLNAYIYSLNMQPQEILKGTKIKVLEKDNKTIGTLNTATGISIIRTALIVVVSVVTMALIFVLIVLSDKKIWSRKDVLLTYTGIDFGNYIKNNDKINYSLIKKVIDENNLKAARGLLISGNMNADDFNTNSNTLHILNQQDYGAIEQNDGVILLIERGRTNESEIDITLSQLVEINAKSIGYLLYE